MKAPALIDEEKIAVLKFPDDEVLASKKDVEKRLWRIQKAIELGEMFGEKVEVQFKDNKSIKAVRTLVIELKDGKIALKHGNSVPLQRVVDIVIY